MPNKRNINSRTTITYQSVVYNMDVKFKNGLCNCAPSKIEGYGKYAWAKGAAERLKNIPKLPDELFEMIKVAPQPTTTPTTARAPRTAPATTTTATATARSCRISRLSDVASPSPSWTTTQPGSE